MKLELKSGIARNPDSTDIARDPDSTDIARDTDLSDIARNPDSTDIARNPDFFKLCFHVDTALQNGRRSHKSGTKAVQTTTLVHGKTRRKFRHSGKIPDKNPRHRGTLREREDAAVNGQDKIPDLERDKYVAVRRHYQRQNVVDVDAVAFHLHKQSEHDQHVDDIRGGLRRT